MAHCAYCQLSTDVHTNNNNSVAVNEFSTGVNPGLLGAALTYVIQLGGLFQWAVRQSAEVENQVNIDTFNTYNCYPATNHSARNGAVHRSRRLCACSRLTVHK
jgi:hypothetical protein